MALTERFDRDITHGIYAIRHVATGDAYVGYSVDVDARFASHVWNLKRGRHSSTRLLAAWKKYGEAAFRLDVLEEIPDFDDVKSRTLRHEVRSCFAKEREQAHVDALGIDHCYNANQPVGRDYRTGRDPKRFKHGTWHGYQVHRCRCRRCRTAWAAYIKDYRYRSGRQKSPRETALAREILKSEEALPAVADSQKDVALTLDLTPLDFQILLAIQRSTRKRRGEIVGELLREHGRALAMSAAA